MLLSPFSIRRVASAARAPRAMGPVQDAMRKKLTESLAPTTLNIRDDSAKHAHHAAMAEHAGSVVESHFDVEIVSAAFEGKPLVQRHRMIYDLLADEFQAGLHALALKTKTPAEAAAAAAKK